MLKKLFIYLFIIILLCFCDLEFVVSLFG